ncbi:MAG: DUF4139 domain-containing protein [Desulfobacterales bacterium]
MIARIFLGLAALALLSLGPAAMPPPAAAQKEKKDDARPIAVGVDERSGLFLTLYQGGCGLVRDQRRVSLPPGTVEFQFQNIPAKILPESVRLHALGEAPLRILEQRFEADLISPQRLLEGHVGKQVKLFVENQFSERQEEIAATLLSIEGGPVFLIDNEVTYNHPGRIIFPKVPEGLVSRPALAFLVENATSKPQRLEAAYLVRDLSWQADYVLVLSEREDRAELTGWATIENESGAFYPGAVVTLVAGDVRMPQQRVRRVRETDSERVWAYKLAYRPGEETPREEFGEVHLYRLERPATIREGRVTQLRFLGAEGLAVKREFVLESPLRLRFERRQEGVSRENAQVLIEIENRKENRLGIPLPRGTVRLYRADAEGALLFAGENRLDAVPRGGTLRFSTGRVFDLTAERRQTFWKKLAADTFEAGWELLLRNERREEVQLRVVESIPGDWTILSASHPHQKATAGRAEFRIAVPPGKEVKLAYTAKYRSE